MYGKEREINLSFPSGPRKALFLTRRQERICTFDSSAKRGSVFISGQIKGFGSPIIDGPELARIQRLFRMILGVAGGRLSLLSGTKAFRPSVSRETDY